jgi:hypothetical protein
MTALGMIALVSADVAFFTPPPHRPGRPERRSKGGNGESRSLFRAFRRELARALDDADANRIRVTHSYPY